MWVVPGNGEAPGCINVVADTVGRASLSTYRRMHTRLGFPAVQKLSRQLFKRANPRSLRR